MSSESGKVAYITGGASGIGKEVAKLLIGKGARVFVADRDAAGAQKVVDEFNKNGKVAAFGQLDVVSWDDQKRVFEEAVELYGRIDYVYPIAGVGERHGFIKNDGATKGFKKPDLSTIDIDLTGVLYTVSLGIQQFRRQEPKDGFRGKLGLVASVCGMYAI